MSDGRFILLDRDGTIIVEKNYIINPEEIELLPESANGLRRMREMGFGLIIITNQSAVGRGMLDKRRLDQIHERMCNLLEKEGITIERVYYCPHQPGEACRCRKPGTALAELATQELGLNPRRSFVVGDKECDIVMGQRLGATTFLVLTGYGGITRAATSIRPDYIVSDLFQAAEIIGNLNVDKARK